MRFIDNNVFVRRIELREHTRREFCQFTHVNEHAIFYRHPGTLRCGLKFLLYLDLFNEIQVRLFSYGGVDLFECVMILCDPDRASKGKVLGAPWLKIKAITKLTTHVKAIRQIDLVINPPSICNWRHKLLPEN